MISNEERARKTVAKIYYIRQWDLNEKIILEALNEAVKEKDEQIVKLEKDLAETDAELGKWITGEKELPY